MKKWSIAVQHETEASKYLLANMWLAIQYANALGLKGQKIESECDCVKCERCYQISITLKSVKNASRNGTNPDTSKKDSSVANERRLSNSRNKRSSS